MTGNREEIRICSEECVTPPRLSVSVRPCLFFIFLGFRYIVCTNFKPLPTTLKAMDERTDAVGFEIENATLKIKHDISSNSCSNHFIYLPKVFHIHHIIFPKPMFPISAIELP